MTKTQTASVTQAQRRRLIDAAFAFEDAVNDFKQAINEVAELGSSVSTTYDLTEDAWHASTNAFKHVSDMLAELGVGAK